jgi:hypothetical protein
LRGSRRRLNKCPSFGAFWRTKRRALSSDARIPAMINVDKKVYSGRVRAGSWRSQGAAKGRGCAIE